MRIDEVIAEDLWKINPNKYESIVVIAKKAREIAKKQREKREKGEKPKEKPIDLAIKDFLQGKIKYTFGSEEEKG
jgi:DNA-directed RNA polymerase omega subunit